MNRTPENIEKLTAEYIRRVEANIGFPMRELARTRARNFIWDVVHGLKTTDLHNRLENRDNKIARKMFTEITGVKLPRTILGTTEAINDWKPMEN